MHERAFLTGGGPIRSGRFRLEVANYGMTPAFLCNYDVHFSTMAEVQAGPQEVFPWYLYSDWIPTGRVPRPLRFFRLTPGAEVVYGPFWYLDWQKQAHIFRFILTIGPRVEQLGIAGVDESYTYWD
jgi:hypothetical protein